MKMQMYCIRDVKVNYRAPFLMHNEEEAKRACQFLVNNGDRQNELFLCPQDFELIRIGEFDDLTAVIDYNYEFVCNLAELKNHRTEVSDNAGEIV